MIKIINLLFCLAFVVCSHAQPSRDLLERETDTSSLNEVLLLKQAWVPYPGYVDREGWNKLTGAHKEMIIKDGEAALDHEWKMIKATDYLAFERSGSRDSMQKPFGENRTALANLVIAELAEGKGRFIDQIINGVWQSCEMTSWALSAHIARDQKEKTSLPSHKEHIIDLAAGNVGSMLAWTYYFLKDEMDKVNLLVSERLRQNLQKRILDPYMERSDFWWQAFNANPQQLVNNWNPWCNFNVLSCFLLLENDADKLAQAVQRSMVSVDQFINYSKYDGACEEGPSYWGHAAGKMYDYLQLLSSATGGKVSIFDESKIKNMGEYIAESYIGDDWVVNFADASAKGKGEIGVIYRYGKAVSSKQMMQYAGYLYQHNAQKPYYHSGDDLYRTFENLRTHDMLQKSESALLESRSTWYPETEFCYMRNKAGFFFAAKGGYNKESHNHNDVGTFLYYLDETPMIIDVGVGTYTRQTFSDERYSIWTMQSNYHNLPMINGIAQSFGAQYRSKDVQFNAEKLSFSLDLAGAYQEEAAVEKWQRSYQLDSLGGLLIEDEFKLTKTNAPNQINFLTWGKPDISKVGTVIIQKEGKTIKLIYDAAVFEAMIEIIPLSDKRLTNVWGKEIYRLSLNAKKLVKSGKYTYTMGN